MRKRCGRICNQTARRNNPAESSDRPPRSDVARGEGGRRRRQEEEEEAQASGPNGQGVRSPSAEPRRGPRRVRDARPGGCRRRALPLRRRRSLRRLLRAAAPRGSALREHDGRVAIALRGVLVEDRGPRHEHDAPVLQGPPGRPRRVGEGPRQGRNVRLVRFREIGAGRGGDQRGERKRGISRFRSHAEGEGGRECFVGGSGDGDLGKVEIRPRHDARYLELRERRREIPSCWIGRHHA
mmetsp:Transcript_40474/g.86215  ORF Transcript_40474/g.86215 Transcript_40474/m.86215 type:complete len:239 (-) Transcript_40474:92-808(-)